MLYYKCPTCGTVLANKQLPFEQELEKICNERISEKEKDKLKMKLLDDLEVKRQCCRMRMLTYVRLIEVVK